jgi:hypothetical protein
MASSKLGCREVSPNEVDYKNPKSILNFLLNLFKVPRSLPQTIPTQLILASKSRPGLSPSLMASRVIQRQAEAGLNVGPLPSGKESAAEIMERIRMEEIVNAITTEMKIDIAVQPGGQSVVSGTAGPIPVVGTAIKTSIDGGSAIAT